jgi:hypothetical protein
MTKKSYQKVLIFTALSGFLGEAILSLLYVTTVEVNCLFFFLG